MQIADVPQKDWDQIFRGVVVKHKRLDNWCFISEFNDREVFLKPFLNKGGFSNDIIVEDFLDDVIELATPSLGMCNTRDGAFFIQRKPSRVMKGGVVIDTLQKTAVRNLRDSEGNMFRFSTGYSKLNHMFNKDYPTLEESVRAAKDAHRSIAFDRQFAVCWDGNIYYKGNTKAVGVVRIDVETLKHTLIWNAGFEILDTVLGDNCAKSLYATKQAPKSRVARSGS